MSKTELGLMRVKPLPEGPLRVDDGIDPIAHKGFPAASLLGSIAQQAALARARRGDAELVWWKIQHKMSARELPYSIVGYRGRREKQQRINDRGLWFLARELGVDKWPAETFFHLEATEKPGEVALIATGCRPRGQHVRVLKTDGSVLFDTEAHDAQRDRAGGGGDRDPVDLPGDSPGGAPGSAAEADDRADVAQRVEGDVSQSPADAGADATHAAAEAGASAAAG